MKHMKRPLAWLLALCMILSVLPMSALAVEADADTTPVETTTEPTENENLPETIDEDSGESTLDNADAGIEAYSDGETTTEYLFVATDRHANTTVIGNIINNMESKIGENELDYLALGGDMVGSGSNHPSYNSSTVLAEVAGATSSLSAANVDIVAGIHDTNVNDDSGIVLPYGEGTGGQIYEGTNYYVYGVPEDCVSDENTAETAATAFVTWANNVADKNKVIIVVSHYPLHAKRGDNTGAGYWHNALNTVATGSATGTEVIRDVVFFHGHNHTVDSNEYCYAPGSTLSIESYVDPSGVAAAAESEIMTVYDEEIEAYASANGTNAIIHYTYATAGYLDANSKATLVTITDSDITLTKYGTSGDGTAMTSVDRVASEEEEETDSTDPTEETTDPTDETTAPTEGTEETTPDEETEEAESNSVTLGSEGEEKTVYVLVSTPTAGKQYLIVSANSAGSGYALTENTTSGTSVTINAATDSITAPYIETSNTAIMWNAASGMTFQSAKGGYYLTQTQNKGSRSLSFSTSSSTNWTVNTNSITYKGNRNSYYLSGGSTWSLSQSSASVYFYGKQTINTSTEVTYTVSAEDIEHIYSTTGGTVDLTATETIMASVLGNGAEVTDLNGTFTYAIVSDPSSILDTTNTDGSTLAFTGNTGTAQVRVYYTWTDSDGKTQKIWTTINVVATYPYYTVDITDTEGESITETIVIKGETAMAAGYELDANVYLNGEDEVEIEQSSVTWASNNTSVATVDETGKVTFGGEGTVQITVYYAYKDNDGETVNATDVVTFSVSKSQYTVPSDGTNDFPEYPNQGAIRFDKTAVAVGSFSQTGLAQVELSMTGVPYSTGSEIDVVIMLDMTGSMTDDSMAAAEAAAQEFADQIIMNEDGTFNDNRISVQVFSKNGVTELWGLSAVTEDTYSSLETAIAGASDNQASGGTPYSTALQECYEILYAAKSDGIGNERKQFCVFVSDGTPTSVTYITDSTTPTTTTTVSFTRNSTTYTQTVPAYSTGTTASTFYGSTSYHEYWSQLMINNDVTVYGVYTSVAAGSSSSGGGSVNDTTEGTNAMTNVASSSSNVYVVDDYTDTSALTGVFTNIAKEIKQAATNVVVEDKIDEHYTVNFGLPSGVTSDEAGMSEFYIQVVEYVLDTTTHERTGVYTVLENFTFNANGTLKSHTVDGEACGDTCNHVTTTDGVITKIEGTYFTYYIDDNGDEFLEWTAEKLSSTELALQYFVYLDNSAGLTQEQVNNGEQVDAGTYNTNEYATLTYTNFNGNECQQEFPIPSLTWNGAQVTYVFYLVNENGEPVNRAGKVVPFAEAIYVTDPVTYDVTWNEEEGSENLLAENLFASANVPDVYELYDEEAYYEIRVYQTEGVDEDTDTKTYNYFVIDGADSGLTSYKTTKVFNTKAGNKYDDYGIYSAQNVGTVLNTTNSAGNATTVTTTVKTTDIDYANTTVAFAVVWKPELVEDTVVIDFGLDVVIDVYTNDGLAAGVTGVMLEAPDVTINSGTYKTAVGSNTVTSVDGLWTATVENLTSVRFHMNEMGINAPAEFYYEAGVNYYTYDSTSNATLNTTNMYSKVTVIPATTVYYEDSFVDFASYTKNDEGTYVLDESSTWETAGTTQNATQDVDRPGAKSEAMSSSYDADNLYGYDSAYTNCSEYSLGSAAMITVDASVRGEATFSFYGTGFDIIGLTSNTTGTLIIQVYDSSNTLQKTSVVNTYYGYAYGDSDNDGTNEWYTVDSNSPNALYQVPVMKVYDLDYGKYTVKLTAGYNSSFDNTGVGKYTLYLDAVRIYDPCGSDNETANNAYLADGEAYPEYYELRDNIINASNVTVTKEEKVAGSSIVTGFDVVLTNDSDEIVDALEGAIFIDGISENMSVSDYVSYGPNNELYLAKDQAIAFKVNLDSKTGYKVTDVQIGIKSANGNEVTYTVNGTSKTIATSTDMYYSIYKYAIGSDGKAATVTITNTSESVLSLTNIKVTYEKDENSATAVSDDEGTDEDYDISTTALIYTDEEVVSYALMSMSLDEDLDDGNTEPDVTEPETTEPEETEPETTEPEQTESEETKPETTEPEQTESEETEPEETEPEPTAPTEDNESDSSASDSTIGKIIKKLFNWLFG